jgi:plastocyanin
MKRILVGLLALVPLAASAQGNLTVQQKNRRFVPAQMDIARGAAITFTNNDEFVHQMYVDGLFDSDGKRPGETLTEAFPRSGTFEVKCHIHPKMKLVVRVK